ncbi:hypothetical protein GIB67_000439 [Kingdonia uniflora]|uniref:EF-hand domain-containing protein n=1 Tax=Kingdonia uniflora TaxID=39325 RepID=A0A7J7MPN6_9MAGN|nr:hypothetical protein GIB67_000439 [Kingdonia uniflora]
MEEVERVFNHFDSNRDGKISSTELKNVLLALGSSASPEEVQKMMDEIDTDGDGFIDLKEFSEFHTSECNTSDELRDAFEMYDKDKNGLISSNELHLVLRSLGENCSVLDCVKMIESVDCDGDGCVNFDEFKMMMSSNK